MNRWMEKMVLLGALSGAVALASPAFAQSGADAAVASPGAHHRNHDGLLGQALALDSLTSQQRTAIEALAQARLAANAPVRAAEAQVLTTLAQEVDAGALDRQALAPSLQAKETAETSVRAADADLTQKLHDLLTPAQRGQVVDAIEASRNPHGPHGGGGPLAGFEHRLGLSQEQEAQIKSNLRAERQAEGHGDRPDGGYGQGKGKPPWLEAFRSDTFTASGAGNGGAGPGMNAMNRRDQRIEDVLQAALPVLTAPQRTELASRLRARAARQAHG